MPLSFLKKSNKFSIRSDLDTTSSSSSEGSVEVPTALSEVLKQLETVLQEKSSAQKNIKFAKVDYKNAPKIDKKVKKELYDKAAGELSEIDKKLEKLARDFKERNKAITEEFQGVVDKVKEKDQALSTVIAAKGGVQALYECAKKTQKELEQKKDEERLAQQELEEAKRNVVLAKDSVKKIVDFYKNLESSTRENFSGMNRELIKAHDRTLIFLTGFEKAKDKVTLEKGNKSLERFIKEAEVSKASAQSKYNAAKRVEDELEAWCQVFNQRLDDLTVIFSGIETQKELLSEISSFLVSSSEPIVEPQITSVDSLTQNMAAANLQTQTISSSTAPVVQQPTRPQLVVAPNT